MSITLNSKAYTFRGFDSQSISRYVNPGSGVPSDFSNLTNRIDINSANTKVRWKLRLPKTAAEASACACPGDLTHEHLVDIVVTVPPTSTSAERTDLMARISDLVASPEFSGSITSLIQASA